MQTRRDQLQAYRFQNRRALAALVKGEPNVLEAPMRRLTVTTLSGILIAILIAAGFAVLALFKPSSGDAWRAGDAVIIDRNSSAVYLYLDHVLHPVVNYPSAVLALGATSSVKKVYVNASDIAGARRGSTIGIDNIPLSLPDPSQLITSPMTVCSRAQPGPNGQPLTKVSLLVGSDAGGTTLPAQSSLLVTSAPGPKTATTPADPGGTNYLLYDGKRLQLGNSAATQGVIEGQLDLNAVQPISVGRAFLNGVPSGTPLVPPQLTGVGTDSGHRIGSREILVGQLVHATDANQNYVMLRDGVGPVDAVEAALLKTLQGPGGAPMPAVNALNSDAVAIGDSATWKAIEGLRTDLPEQLPTVPATASDSPGVCARYSKNSDAPAFTLPSASTQVVQGTVTETAVSEAGFADSVVVAPNHAVVGEVMGKGSADFLISDAGRLFPVTSPAVLAGFGYGSVKPTPLPAQIVSLIQPGPALDPVAARRPVSN